MTTEPLDDPAPAGRGSSGCARELDEARRRPARSSPTRTGRRRTAGGPRTDASVGRAARGDVILSVESSCDETGIAVIQGGRTIRSNVVASQTALHAASGGIVPEVAARAHLRWIVPVLDEALGDAGVGVGDVDAVAVTYGPGPGGVAARRAQLREDARLGPRQAARRGQPPRGPPLRRVAARPGVDEAEPAEPVFPLVALIVSRRPHVPRRDARPPDLPPARPDRRRRRRRGVRQGRPAARAVVPGRAGDLARGRGRDAPRRGVPAGLARRQLRLQLQRPEDGRAPDDRRGPADEGLPTGRDAGRSPTPASRTTRPPSSPGASRTRSSTCSPRRRSGRPRQTGARSIVLGGGVAANSALRTRLAGEAEALGLPLIVPRPALCTDNGAMIGAAGARRFAAGERADLSLDARPSLPLARR